MHAPGASTWPENPCSQRRALLGKLKGCQVEHLVITAPNPQDACIHTHCHTALGVCTHAAAPDGASPGGGSRRMLNR